MTDRRVQRSGDALVCLGCGDIQYSMQAFESVLEQPGATLVEVAAPGPFR